MRLALYMSLKIIGDCMESHNRLIDTTHNPPPLSFYNTLTFAQHVLKKLFNFYFGFTITGSF